MSVLKKMTGTDNFLELPSEGKNCQTDAFEDCQAERYITEVQTKCGCVPWALNLTPTQKVGRSSSSFQNFKPSQDDMFCSPNDSPCLASVSTTHTYGCEVSCTGLYADVHFTEDNILSKSWQQTVTELAAKGEDSYFCWKYVFIYSQTAKLLNIEMIMRVLQTRPRCTNWWRITGSTKINMHRTLCSARLWEIWVSCESIP